ncbi:MAG: efflux RND transporter periplasmic adaptor subunit [Aquabacterium sp.]|nr:efflux RND transporter periplasmic adaptor subunit [Aquabacterium sp.]
MRSCTTAPTRYGLSCAPAAAARYPWLPAAAAAVALLAGLTAQAAGNEAPGLKQVATSASLAATPAAINRSVLAVETVRLRQMKVDRNLGASGNVAASQEASVSPKTGGLRVARIHAQVGSRVKRGELMLEFDDDTLRAELAQLEANVAEAEAAAADAQRSADRARRVGESGALSAQQVEQLVTAEATSRARVRALKESVNLQQLRLQQARLVAPDEGIVSQRAATLGAVVPAGIELFRIIRGGRLEWRAEVPASELVRLAPGTAARIVLEDGTALEGRVRLVAPTVDPVTRQGIAYVDLPVAGALRPGMFVRGELLLGGGQSWVLPQSAVMLRDGFHVVATVGADQRVRFAKVGVGRRQGALIEISQGLAPEAPVVAKGAALLGEGDLVRVVGAVP